MSSDQQIGDYLRGLRSEARLDLAVLARRVSLSPAQVAQLERGESGLFYNRRIRQQAARKVIAHLGGDPARVQEEAAPTSSAVNPPDIAVKTARVPLTAQAPAAAMPSQAASAAPRPARRRPSLGLVLTGVCAMAVAAVLWMSQGASPGSQMLVMSAPAAASVTPEPAPPGVQVLDEPATAAQEPSAAPQPVPTDALSTAASAEAASCASTAADQTPRVQPPQAAKPGDMVYVVSKVDQVVCLRDASGKQHQQRLEAGQARSFYGQPPWLVHTAQLRETQLFFQGWKVKLPEDAQDRVQLVELR